MKQVAAYLLCVLGGNASPAAADVEKVITSIGAEADMEKIELLVKELEGKDINEVVAAGKAKLANVSIGGASASGAAASGAAASGTAAATAVVEKEEEEEEADLGGGMDMFGGGDDY